MCIFSGFIVPSFIFISFDIGLVLHRRQKAKYFGIKFDVCVSSLSVSLTACLLPCPQEDKLQSLPFVVGSVVLGCVVLCVLGILVNTGVLGESSKTGREGYSSLASSTFSFNFFLSVLPSLLLSLFSLYLSRQMIKYSSRVHLDLTSSIKWWSLFVGSACQLAGQVFHSSLLFILLCF